MKATVICDGRGNAGTGARAAVLYDEKGKKLAEKAEKIEPTTNIVAEHLSIQLGMELALSYEFLDGSKVTDLTILNDSQTPVNHVIGVYKVDKPHIKPLVEKTREMGLEFDSVSIRWVPRSETHAADRLCRLVDKKPAKRSSRPGGPLPQEPERVNPFAPQG